MASVFALPLDTAPMEAKAADVLPDDSGLCSTSRNGTASAALPLKTLWSTCAPSPASHSVDISLNLSMRQGPSADRFVVDGETVIQVDGALSFDDLQMRLHPADNGIPSSLRRHPPASSFSTCWRGRIASWQPQYNAGRWLATFS